MTEADPGRMVGSQQRSPASCRLALPRVFHRPTRPRATVRLRSALALAVFCACSRPDSGHPSAGEKHPAQVVQGITTEELLSGTVHRLDIHLSEAMMAELAREPRDYVRGSVQLGEQRLDEVGIRFKGHRSLRSWADKPAFKLNFGKYRKRQRLAGLRTLSLNNMVEDPTLLREQLAYRVFRALGAPAPHVGHAEVFVNGERFGLYALVEPIDGPLLARSFDTKATVVYEGDYGCDVYPGDVWGMEMDEGDDPQRAHLGALSRAASNPPMTLLEGDGALLHREHFFSFLAASIWTGDFDGYRHGHNYRLYLDGGTGRWSLIPWGLDRALKRELGPYDIHGRLARACFADATCRLEHVKTMHSALHKLAKLDLPALFDQLSAKIEAAASRDGRKPHGKKRRMKERAKLRAFISSRSETLRGQLSCWDGSQELDRDGDGFGCLDCNDEDPAVYPGAQERCGDGVDRDCSGHADDTGACGCREVTAEGARFALCDFPRSWSEAAAFCRARGAVLAFLDSKRQARALQALAEDVHEEDWWIGLNDRQKEGEARYVQSTSSFRYWASGEPDDYACGEDCAALKEDAKGRFRDLHCARPLPFVCRSDPPASPGL